MREIAIIGVGPRGGYALERLIVELAEKGSLSHIRISLFEATKNWGNSFVYAIDQNESNWINITERALELDKRETIDTEIVKIKSFPSYHEWINKDFSLSSKNEIDSYPPRAKIGQYLSERFLSLANELKKAKILTLYNEQVNKVELLDTNKVHLSTHATNKPHEYDEVLLTIGHQPTEPSQQIMEWDVFATDKKNINLFKSPYPVSDYLEHDNLTSTSIIGIRGFGLAMIDAVRAIALKFGNFSIDHQDENTYIYKTTYDIKDMFVPFSLDGLPPVPKPLNARIDNWFKPTEATISNFAKQIGDSTIQKDANSPQFLIDAFAPIAATIFIELLRNDNTQNYSKQQIEKLVMQWLQNDLSMEHILFTSDKQPVIRSIQEFVLMATGKCTVSLDYCIGQVWRHMQPTMYKALSYNNCSDAVFAEIIALDEATKRYSYGPPVESMQQLVALLRAGLLSLDMVNDPEIKLTQDGWQFEESGQTITATIMIDSIVDAPKVTSVSSSLIQNMLDDNLLKVVHDDLGVKTDEYGYLLSSNSHQQNIPISLLGRLAKGTVIGVDAILECFGERPRQWAQKAAQNHVLWLAKN